MTELPVRYTDSLAPGEISRELQPVISTLSLEDNCRELAEEGWTVIENIAGSEFNQRFRDNLLELCDGYPGRQMLLAEDPLIAEAVLDPRLVALAEFSVGRGFLLSQVAASVRGKGSPVIGLHADNNWLPAPFQEQNRLLTACWACDDYSEPGGSTLIIPGSNKQKRHPNDEEIEALDGAVAIECPAGSVVLWDGNIWHSNYPRNLEAERVVCHITYTRLAMRPVEDYAAVASELIETHGGVMAQMLGRDDFLFSAKGADYRKLNQTFNNAKR